MSFEALARVRDVAAPSSSALLLLYILAEYADADGCCYPSQATLAHRSQLSVRAVRANLSLLRKRGLIDQVQRRRKDGSRTSDRCRLLFYTAEQAAESAACDLAKTPSKDRQTSKRQFQPLDKRQITTGQPASAAGLTTFEPVREHISLGGRETADAQLARTVHGLAGEGSDQVQSEIAEGSAEAELWHRISEGFEARDRGQFASYLSRARLVSCGQALYVVAWTATAKTWLQQNWWRDIALAWRTGDTLTRALQLVDRAEYAARLRHLASPA